MNRMKNDGPFAELEEQSIDHHEGDWKEWKEITFGYTIIYLYHFMFIPFSSTAFFAAPVQQMAAFSIHADPNWQWHLKSMRIKSVPCWNAILSHAMYSEQYNQEKFNVSLDAEAGIKWIWLQKTFRLAEQAIIARTSRQMRSIEFSLCQTQKSEKAVKSYFQTSFVHLPLLTFIELLWCCSMARSNTWEMTVYSNIELHA